MEEKQIKLLIVEDDFFIRDIYTKKFSSLGFMVEIAENGNSALKKLETLMPDIILMDVTMPYLDGLEVLEEIKKKPNLRSIPILILSNISEKEKVEKALEMGADNYLIKSHFTPLEVVAKVDEILEKRNLK